MPVVFLLLFVYVFGGTLGAGLGGATGGRGDYVNYVVPGIILLTVATKAQGTAASAAIHMTEGIIVRFRTMAIARAPVLAGHVLGNMIQTMLSLGRVIGVALLVGFRPTAGPVEWVAAIAVLAMIALALTGYRSHSAWRPRTSRARATPRRFRTPIGSSAVLAVAWCAGITLVGSIWAMTFNRDPVR